MPRVSSRFLFVATFLQAAVSSLGPAHARPPVGTAAPPSSRTDEFSGWFHSAGNLVLHVSNRGLFGNRGLDQTFPSGEWPAGSSQEYLFAAGLWVGGVVDRGGVADTLVSAGLYQESRSGINWEFLNLERGDGCGDPPQGICETFEGAPGGSRNTDDDGDGRIDEDPLDGRDNDGDGRIDEDFAGISQQMFRTVYTDTSTIGNTFIGEESNHHTPLGLEVVQESYAWTDPAFDDFIGIEFSVTNISHRWNAPGWDIESAYIGFMVDGDVGVDAEGVSIHLDDQSAMAELDTTIVAGGEPIDLQLTMGYAYDTQGSQNDDVPGFLGVMFLGHSVDTTSQDASDALAPREVGIHAFRLWTSDGEDPRDDLDRYRFLRGFGDTSRTIDPPSAREADWRFLVSAGPFAKIPPGSTLTFQVAFVCGNMLDRVDPETGATVRVPDFTNPIQAQRVYDGVTDADGTVLNWTTSSPPPPPNIAVSGGDESVIVEWDDFPESALDPLTRERDFAGYQVWKAEGWKRESNIPTDEMWRLIADFDTTEISDLDTGHAGLGQYRFVDTNVQNGFWYWYAVSAYDRGTFREQTTADGDTILVRVDPPRFGKFTQNMMRVMPIPTQTQTLDDIFVAPNPYRESAAWDLAETSFEPTGRRIKFYNLPSRATIRIFTVAGDHVRTIEHDERGAGNVEGQTHWNLVSKNNQDSASGIYLYQISTPAGEERVGKFVVIR